jgi:outer membrane usher protein FimD/PapC
LQHPAEVGPVEPRAPGGVRAAWSRPITGSFALIERNPKLPGVQVGVNPTPGGYVATTDSFGLAVVPGLEPYRVNPSELVIPTGTTGVFAAGVVTVK